MIFLPVIERELRVRSRQGTTYWIRCAAAAMTSLLALLITTRFFAIGGFTTAGPTAFASLSWLGLFVTGVSGVVTADCVSVERREGTLGLIFLTDLAAFEVACGKLLAAGLTGFFIMLGALPALSLAFFSGGVTGGQVARTALSLASVLFLSLTAGLLASTQSSTPGQALRRAALYLASIFAGPWLAGALLSVIGSWSWSLTCLSPLRSFLNASDTAYAAAPRQYWVPLGLAMFEAFMLLSVAALELARNWNRLDPPAKQPARWSFTPRRRPSATPALLDRRSRLLESDPVCWLSLRFHDQSTLIWIGAVLLVFSGPVMSMAAFMTFRVVGGSSATSLSNAFVGGIGPAMSLFSGFAPALIFAWVAGKFFLDARQDGELELLLSTPLGGSEIVRGRWHALLIRFRGPLLFAGFLLFLQFIFAIPAVLGSTGLLFRLALSPIVTALDAVAVFWVGMWFGMSAKKPLGVVIWPAALVIGFPWIIGYSLSAVLTVTPRFPAFFTSWPAWPLLVLAKDVFFIRWAAQKLRNEFRASAAVAVGNWAKTPEELTRDRGNETLPQPELC